MDTYVLDLFDSIAFVVARRIAVLAQTDSEAAAKDFEQHVSAMSAEEKAIFQSYVVNAALDLEN